MHALSWSPDGSLLAVGTNTGGVHLLETAFFETVYVFQAHPLGRDFIGREDQDPQSNYIRDIRWSRDGTLLITGSGEGAVRVWDARRLGERRRATDSH